MNHQHLMCTDQGCVKVKSSEVDLSLVYIGKGYAITPVTGTVTIYLPWPPWAM